MIFKLHEQLIPQIKATIKAYGLCYVHGCGNLYADAENSDNRKNYANPDHEEATYRIKFTNTNEVPSSIDELEKKLLAAKNAEIMQERTIKEVSGIRTIKVENTEEETKQEDNTDALLLKEMELSDKENDLAKRESALEEKLKAIEVKAQKGKNLQEQDKTEE